MIQPKPTYKNWKIDEGFLNQYYVEILYALIILEILRNALLF